MQIRMDFPGGNGIIRDITDNTITMVPDLRDTSIPWFYWMFQVTGAQGKTLHFRFPENCVGYLGGAVSPDGEHWRWAGGRDNDGNGFSYTFGAEEDSLYFCHDMRYPVERFVRFAEGTDLLRYPFARTRHGREVPAYLAGTGDRYLLLTSRHHCCESTGTWVLEGVVRAYLENPIPGLRLMTVPFIDLDGVEEGDQGKSRIPFDHCHDYVTGIYPETRAMLDFAESHSVAFYVDCHSPWHLGGRNDHVFLSGAYAKEDSHTLCLEPYLLEANRLFPGGLCYDPASSVPFYCDWNQDLPRGQETSKRYFARRKDVIFSASMETTYFGTLEDPVSTDKLLLVGKRLYWALRSLYAAQ